jgi:hypothetical protein
LRLKGAEARAPNGTDNFVDAVQFQVLSKRHSGRSGICPYQRKNQSNLKIKYGDRVNVRQNKIYNPFVIRVGKIRVASSGVVKCHDKAVGETLVQVFRAAILAGNIILDPWNGLRNVQNLIKELFNLFLRSPFFELNERYVFNFCHKNVCYYLNNSFSPRLQMPGSLPALVLFAGQGRFYRLRHFRCIGSHFGFESFENFSISPD